LLEENNIHVCLLLPNTTDKLQPLDVAVNKPAKEFYRQKFQEWYSGQVSQQIEELDGCVMALEPVNVGLQELGAKWQSTSTITLNLQFEDSDEDTSDDDYEEDDEGEETDEEEEASRA